MSNIKKCIGCGATLTTVKGKAGYVRDLNMDMCEACFKLKHYHEVENHFHPEYIPNLKPNSLILVVSSVLYLDLVFTYPVKRYQPNSKVVYLINQVDLLPRNTNLDYLLKEVKKEANKYNAIYDSIVLMSSKNPYDLKNLEEFLLSFDEKDIYLLGVQNSGKTTIFNYLTNSKDMLTDPKAGLTQEEVRGLFYDKNIYDLPGLYQPGYIHEFLPYKEYRKMIPLKEIKPVNYRYQKDDAFIISKLFSITFKGNKSGVIVFYFNNLEIHKTNNKRVVELMDKVKDKRSSIEYTKTVFSLKEKAKYQITIADIGVIHIEGKEVIELIYPKGLHISLRKAFFR